MIIIIGIICCLLLNFLTMKSTILQLKLIGFFITCLIYMVAAVIIYFTQMYMELNLFYLLIGTFITYIFANYILEGFNEKRKLVETILMNQDELTDGVLGEITNLHNKFKEYILIAYDEVTDKVKLDENGELAPIPISTISIQTIQDNFINILEKANHVENKLIELKNKHRIMPFLQTKEQLLFEANKSADEISDYDKIKENTSLKFTHIPHCLEYTGFIIKGLDKLLLDYRKRIENYCYNFDSYLRYYRNGNDVNVVKKINEDNLIGIEEAYDAIIKHKQKITNKNKYLVNNYFRLLFTY